MELGEAVVGVSQWLVPGLLALFFGEVRRRGEPVRIIRMLWESGRS